MHCYKCRYGGEGLTVGKSQYYTKQDGTKSRYVKYICRSCNAEKKRAERQRRIPALQRAEDAYRKKYPEKHRARKIAQKNIPLQPCEICGNKKFVARHHPDHSKPLDIVFLCPVHHKQAHLKQGELFYAPT